MRTRTRLTVVLVALVGLVLVACSGPISIAQPFPITGESIQGARINSCMPYGGRINVAVDVTAGANPGWIKIGVTDDATGWEAIPAYPDGFHWEGTGSHVHAAGACIVVQIDAIVLSPGNPEWEASNKTFRYTVSIVP